MSSKVCINCGLTAELLCSRCQDPYCSRQCQRADWNSHRSICFTLPPLVRDMSAMDLNSTRSVNELQSSVSQEEKEKKIFPQKKSISEIEKKTTKPVERETKVEKEVLKPLAAKEQNPVRNASVAVEQKEQVAEKVIADKRPAPDSQKKSTLSAKQGEEKAAPSKLLSAIENVPMKKPSEPEKAMALKKPLPLKLPPMAGRGIKLPDKVEPLKKPESVPPQKQEPPKPLMMSHLKVRNWPESKNIRTKILGLIEHNLMTLREDKEDVADYFEFIKKSINERCKNFDKSDYKPIVGEVIYTKFEGEWYRANVLEMSPEKTVIKYIDYGNFEELKPGTMFPATEGSFEICARDFFIDNISEELTEKQMEIVFSGELTITDVRKEADGFFHCSIFGF